VPPGARRGEVQVPHRGAPEVPARRRVRRVDRARRAGAELRAKSAGAFRRRGGGGAWRIVVVRPSRRFGGATRVRSSRSSYAYRRDLIRSGVMRSRRVSSRV
jgi:hypothetical protein